MNARVYFQDPHKMAKAGFLFQPLKDFALFILGQDPTGSEFNDIDLTKQVVLVLFIDFSFTDEDVQEAFLYQHMKDVVLFVFEEENDEGAEEFGFFDGFEDFQA